MATPRQRKRPPRKSESDRVADEDRDIINEAKDRMKICAAWEGVPNQRARDDLRFANGDPDNGYQWPNEYLRRRQVADRPCLTVNRISFHNNLIINDARKNKAAIKIIPVAGDATKKSADIYNGLVRHTEYISNAQSAYDTALELMVECGIGYWRVLTKYVDDDSMDQEIFIQRVRNPFSVYTDPDAQEADYLDMRYAFVWRDIPRSEAKRDMPTFRDVVDTQVNADSDGWLGKDYLRFSEYFRLVHEDDELLGYVDSQTQQERYVRASEIGAAMAKQLRGTPGVRARSLRIPKVEWFLIVGNKIADRTVWPGKYVPIIKVVGKERVIDGRLDRKGHTRQLKDTQRMLNYFYSAAVEGLGLQTKAPWVGELAAIEGYEELWFNANNRNPSFLPFNGWDDDNSRQIPAPTRPEPPVMSQGYKDAIQISQMDMMAVSGQYEAARGQQGNEVSGKAIGQRQGQSDTATFHFIDNLSRGIQATGKILLDLYPKIYDTRRVVRIIDPAGDESRVTVDPQMQEPYKEGPGYGDAVERFFNPNVGKYEVQADVGPAYATRRQEAFDAYVQVITQAPDLMKAIGDLVFKNADFPGADDIAERLRRMIPPEILGEGPNPNEQQLMQQVQSLSQMLESAIKAAAESEKRANSTKLDKTADAYRATTDRIKVLAGGLTPEQVIGLVSTVVQDALATEQALDKSLAQTDDMSREPAPINGSPQAALQAPMGDSISSGVPSLPMGND